MGPVRVLLVTNTSDSGSGSLRQAVLDANTPSPNSTAFPTAYAEIRFSSGLPSQTITLTPGQLTSSLRTKFIGDNSLAPWVSRHQRFHFVETKGRGRRHIGQCQRLIAC